MFKNNIFVIWAGFISLLFLLNNAVAESLEVNFAYIGPDDHSALLGAQQGLVEANLQGQFLKQKYNLDIIPAKNAGGHDFSNYIAVLTAVDTEDFLTINEQIQNAPVFNLTIENNNLRTECINNALHIIPSTNMKDDAVKQWLQKKPQSKVIAQAWHPDFVKFAARDLNKRFKKNHNVVMDDNSWAGWAAIKMTSDAVARTQITEPEKMLHYLKTALSFDGQKGIDMNFRETGQLRQPILLIENDKIVTEAPVRGVAKPPTLDSLGILSCQK